jgi:hypothetical protein
MKTTTNQMIFRIDVTNILLYTLLAAVVRRNGERLLSDFDNLSNYK